ncbi:MAG: hypothetical protein A2V66_01905 [Ignavibacteria bacterium RBG_13_36_8]|nr:MAG: hypothetical protein A2V66_01905 [Ignavibacteria bacterium RBG_13_36_8]
MIARIWKGTTSSNKSSRYLNYMEKTGVQSCLNVRGNLGIIIFEKPVDRNTEFTFISLWDSFKSIRNFSNTASNDAVLFPEDKNFLIRFDTKTNYQNCFLYLPKIENESQKQLESIRYVPGLLI